MLWSGAAGACAPPDCRTLPYLTVLNTTISSLTAPTELRQNMSGQRASLIHISSAAPQPELFIEIMGLVLLLDQTRITITSSRHLAVQGPRLLVHSWYLLVSCSCRKAPCFPATFQADQLPSEPLDRRYLGRS